MQNKGLDRVKKTIQAGLTPGATAPTAVYYGDFAFSAFTVGDDAYVNAATPSDWEDGTGITIYIDWGCDEAYATASGEIQWQIDWSECEDGEDFAAPTATGQIKSGDINIPATAKEKIRSTIGTIDGSDLTRGALLGLKLSRVAIDDGNNPTAEPATPGILIEYTSNVRGQDI